MWDNIVFPCQVQSSSRVEDGYQSCNFRLPRAHFCYMILMLRVHSTLISQWSQNILKVEYWFLAHESKSITKYFFSSHLFFQLSQSCHLFVSPFLSDYYHHVTFQKLTYFLPVLHSFFSMIFWTTFYKSNMFDFFKQFP